MTVLKVGQERQPAPMPDQLPVPALVVKDIVTFRDRDTGELIPKSQIEENMLWIDRILKLLEEGRTVHREALKETKNDYWEAGKRSNAFQGEGCSELWDQLAESKVVCALDLLCPPAKDKGAMYANEKRVSIMIGQASEYMFKNIVDIWTSRIEIGSAKETYVYARYPYHLWQMVEELGTKISTMNVGTHHFSASLSMNARKKWQWQEHVEQWQLECNGCKLPGIRKEDLQVLQAAANTSFAEKFATQLNVKAIDKAGIAKELHCAHDFLWGEEVDHMKQTETWRIFNMLSADPGSLQHTRAMFQLCGIIMGAADTTGVPKGNYSVFCFEVKEPLLFPDSPLFYDLYQGDTFVTLDKPFVIKMGQSDLIKHDTGVDGVVVIICWTYQLDAQRGVRLNNAGLCFMQHLTCDNHLCNLLSLAKLLKPQMTKFGTKIACMQAAQSSSTAVSEFQGASITAGSHATACNQLT